MSRQLPPGRYQTTDLRPGDWIDCGTARITSEGITEFAAISGDRFEIHLDDARARARGLDRQVAHGLFVMARVEGLIRNAPAQITGADLNPWDWRFRQPVLADEWITVRCILSDNAVRAARKHEPLCLTAETRNQDGVLVLTGETLLKAPD
ncbi:MAG: MaoC family dehydratase [Pseudomonadota bacterium]